MNKLKVYKLREDAGRIFPPAKQGDVGYDLEIPARYAGTRIRPNESVVIDMGIELEFPNGHYGRIEPRSSKFLKGLLFNATIDYGYTGEIKLVLWNVGRKPYTLLQGERVAQLIISPFTSPEIVYNDGKSDRKTERGNGGFGHTTNP